MSAFDLKNGNYCKIIMDQLDDNWSFLQNSKYNNIIWQILNSNGLSYEYSNIEGIDTPNTDLKLICKEQYQLKKISNENFKVGYPGLFNNTVND